MEFHDFMRKEPKTYMVLIATIFSRDDGGKYVYELSLNIAEDKNLEHSSTLNWGMAVVLYLTGLTARLNYLNCCLRIVA